MYAELSGDVTGIVPASVIDYEILDEIDAFDAGRERAQSFRQMITLVKTRNLDNQLHRHPAPAIESK